MQNGETPNVSDYIVECVIDDNIDLPLWVLSAGKRDDTYSQKLASIDWCKLYSEHEGFLMFVDFKQQLRQQTHGFDYILIDSRTGHTDVGGICTRQLPDAVVGLFYPNDENISGLASVAQDIRNQQSSELFDEIQLIFCPSNVPYLDDEDDMLNNIMSYASSQLKCEEFATIIHHYNSLDFIKQTVFVSERPKTRLAEEYRKLTSVVVRKNLEDREGALGTLRAIKKAFRLSQKKRGLEQFTFHHDQKQVDKIQGLHPKDGEVAWELASIYSQWGALDAEADALTIAIESRFQTLRALRKRAANWLTRGGRNQALIDLRSILESENVTSADVSAATELLRQCDPNWVEILKSSSAISRLAREEKLPLAYIVTRDPRGSQLAASIYSDVMFKEQNKIDFILSLIGSAQFGKAMKHISSSREELFQSNSINDIFNYAMAEWGATDKIPHDLLKKITELDKNKPRHSANYFQCMAICYALLDDTISAQVSLRKSRDELGPGPVFSAWRYLTVSQHEMLKDLDALEEAINTGAVRPPFLDRRAELTTE
jgi:hypothetical protein